MARMKRGMWIASMLMLVMVLTSACKTPYSQAPAATLTPISQNFFATPVNGSVDMNTLQAITTQTALAQTTPGAPVVASPTVGVGVTPQTDVTATATPLVVTNPTSTLAVAPTTAAAATSAPVTGGSQYVLKSGEFPYCIARRFNVDPDDMLRLSGLSDGVLYDPGTVLTIPSSGSFPGNRMLRNHPATYTAQAGETIYSVACAFGDVSPNDIASKNGISVDAILTAGQVLNIP